jgi:hypothetical protein
MRIIEMQVDNIKGIRTANVHPTDDVVIISGKNGQGKSSLLDAMFLALAGGKATRMVEQPIRRGETNATVKLDLGDFTVTKMWTTSGSVLDVRTKEGIQVPSQQEFLNKLTGALWFDPLAFAGMKEKDQRAMLLDLVELPFDPEELAQQKAKVFEDRTDANREVKALQARLDAAPPPEPDVPDEEISTAEVMKQYTIAQGVLQANENERLRHARQEENVTALEARHDSLLEQLRLVKEELDKAREDLFHSEGIQGSLEDPDLTIFETQLATAEETNVKVREKNAYRELHLEWQQADQVAKDLDNQLKVITEAEREAIADAAMPIEGLGFTEVGVTFNDTPFKDLSASEQLKVSVAMGMALNPTLRVMRVMDGSLLDSDAMAHIAEVAASNDYQVWIEVVSDSGDVGFVIRDGTIINQPESEDDPW